MKTVIIFGRRYPVRGLLTAFGGMLMMVGGVRSKYSNLLFVTNNFRSVSRPSFPLATSWLMQFLTWGTTLTRPWHMQTLYMSLRYSSCVNLLVVIVRFIWQGKALVSGCTSFISGILARKLGLRPTFIIGCILYRSCDVDCAVAEEQFICIVFQRWLPYIISLRGCRSLGTSSIHCCKLRIWS